MSSDKFSIVVEPHAAKELKKLRKSQPELTTRLTHSIDSLISNPYQGKALKGSKKGCYSLPEGDYRIIYEIYLSQKVVHIIRVGHRREVYR